jgi:cell division protease FtsH
LAAVVDSEIRKLIDNAHQEAFDILEANRAILDELVIVLLEKETILKDEIEEVFKNVRSVKPRPAWTGSDSRKPSNQPPVAIPDSAKEKPKKRATRKKAE